MLPRKVIQQTTNTVTLSANGGVMVVNAPWLIHPTQGLNGEQVANALAGQLALLPAVRWQVQAGSAQTSLGNVQAVLTSTSQGYSNDTDRYSRDEDVTGELLENQSITASLVDCFACQYRLTLTNWSSSTLTVFVRMTVTSAWLPHPAPAEFQDGGGFGWTGVVGRDGTGYALPNVRPGAVAIPGAPLVPSLPADWQDDPMAGGSL